MLARLGFAAILAVCTSVPVQAQYAPKLNQQQLQQMQQRKQLQQIQQYQMMEIQGVLENMARGHLVVVDDKNQTWQIAVPTMAKLHILGTANADCLRNGMLIEFTAEIDDHGALKEKIGELTVISPSPDKPMGLFPAEAADEKKEEAAAEPNDNRDKKSAKPIKPAKHPGGKSAGTGAVLAGSYRIVGRLIAGRNGKLSIHVGRGTMPLELTEQPTVNLDISDFSGVSKGDKIKVKGVMMTARPGMAQATEVTIELSQPLTGTTRKMPAAKSDAKHPSKRSEKETGLPEPAADQ
jgi:hypothetical protein